MVCRHLEGLENLVTAGELYVADNPGYPAAGCGRSQAQTGTQCVHQDGAIVAECTGNHGQGSCGELPEGFTCAPGATGPGVYDGSIYIDSWSGNADDLLELGGVTCITGTLHISNRPDVTSLSMLSSLQQIGWVLSLTELPSLENLHGLENLTTVGDQVLIANNAQLSSLAALSNLTEINADGYQPYPGQPTLQIYNNASLPACWVWQMEAQTGVDCQSYSGGPGWSECSGNHGQGSCGTLPEGFECVPGATGPGVYDGSIYIDSWSGNADDLLELGGVTCITGTLHIGSRPNVTSLSMLS